MEDENSNKLDIAVLQSEFAQLKELLLEIHKDVKQSGKETHSIKDQLGRMDYRITANEKRINRIDEEFNRTKNELGTKIDKLTNFMTEVRTVGAFAIIVLGVIQFLIAKFL